jgi:hypothetical protein
MARQMAIKQMLGSVVVLAQLLLCCQVGTAQFVGPPGQTAVTAASSTPTALQYHASLTLMHPLVNDVYTMALTTNQPIEWADAHYVVLQRTDPFNVTALNQKQINFMMQVSE